MTTVTSDPSRDTSTLFGQGLLAVHPRLALAVLLVMILAAIAVRAYRLDAAGLLVDREFTSAMFARNFYFSSVEGVEPWRRDIARVMREKQPDLEPPVTEWLVAQAYRLMGYEDLRLARAITSLFWIAGGVFLFCIIRNLVSVDAAVFGVGYYLFTPMSVLLSRSFQPDSLMMLTYLASLWAIVTYYEEPSNRKLLFAALMAVVTLVYRPLVMPALAAAFVVPQVQRHGFWKGLLKRPSIVYGLVGILPAILYYTYASVIAHYFGWKVADSFRFHLWAHSEYWRGWVGLAVIAAGAPFLIAAVVGFFRLRGGLPRGIVVGMSIGYLVFCLMFTMHIHTHGYYHAQLIPLVAITASPLAAAAARWTLEPSAIGRKGAAVIVVVLIAVVWTRDVHRGLDRARFEPPTVAREIGNLVNHSDRVVFLSRYYGLALQYNGEFTGAYWPRAITYWLYRTEGERELSIAERLDALGFEPQYFVITFFSEYERHHKDLAGYLEGHCYVKAWTSLYLIYERCRPLDAG